MPRSNIGRSFRQIIAEGSRDMFTVTGADGTLEYVSRAALHQFGLEPGQLLGTRLEDLAHPEDVELVHRAVTRAERAADDVVTTMWRLRCADGSHRWAESLSTLVVEGDDRFVVSTIRDVSSRHDTEIDLRDRATTDPLTGVANRRVLRDHMEQALRRLERHGGHVALLFLDIDRFKHVNDTIGHRAGDAVLTQLADRLRSLLRAEDTVARLGGDEFVVLVEDVDDAGHANALADRIVAAVRAPFTVDGHDLACTVSIGVTVTDDAHSNPDDLLEEADLALYRAKNDGRDRADTFDDALRRRALSRLGLAGIVRRAVSDERMSVVYRPVVDLRTRTIAAVEATSRIWDPDRGIFLPTDRLADRLDHAALLAPVEEWHLEAAVDQAAAWRDAVAPARVPVIAVKLSARQLADPHLVPNVLDALDRRHLSPHALQLEVTEPVMLDAVTASIDRLATLRQAGVAVVLDGFGSGHASLSYLRRLPLDQVALDRSLVAPAGHDDTERAVLRSIVELCHALGLVVVADGVDDQHQLDALVSIGCDRARGDHLGRPVPQAAIESLLHLTPPLGSANR
ncbi:MAG: putative bifunctional diguanylate cyclase/phosphodiesterase [Acidimicrobiales bacterium]